jgi:hypothetical protein
MSNLNSTAVLSFYRDVSNWGENRGGNKMSTSLKARFNGNSQEVVNYAREYGVLASMQQYQVKDYCAMLAFLQQQAPDEVFSASKVGAASWAINHL